MMGRYVPPWRQEYLDAHEITRLEIVSAACEIVVLAELMDNGPKTDGRGTSPAEPIHGLAGHRRAALELLGLDAGLEALPQDRLLDLLASIRQRVREVRSLRNRVDSAARR